VTISKGPCYGPADGHRNRYISRGRYSGSLCRQPLLFSADTELRGLTVFPCSRELGFRVAAGWGACAPYGCRAAQAGRGGRRCQRRAETYQSIAVVGSLAGPVGVVVGAAVGIGIALAASSAVESFFGSLF
jgi:hypothetical protein